MAEPKDGLALIIGGKPKGGSKSEPLDEKADAMRDLGEALAAKDWSGAAMAFERAYEICEMHGDEGSEEEESEEPGEESRY